MLKVTCGHRVFDKGTNTISFNTALHIDVLFRTCFLSKHLQRLEETKIVLSVAVYMTVVRDLSVNKVT